jgi:hypothetical protein
MFEVGEFQEPKRCSRGSAGPSPERKAVKSSFAALYVGRCSKITQRHIDAQSERVSNDDRRRE